MALSGTIKGTTSNDYISAKIEWTATQSISGNYSDVTATLYYSRTNTGYTTYGTWSGSITINGTKTSGSKSIEIKYNSNTQTLTVKTRVYHNNDGSKSITISASGQISGTTLTSTSISGTVTLDKIARSSSLSLSAASVDVGSTITANISRADSSFTHAVEFYINNTYYQKYTSVGTSQSYTIPTSWYSAMPSSSSCTAYCRITTYSGSTQVGDQVSKSFTVKVPNSICPSISSDNITLSPVGIKTSDNVSRSILVKGKNKLTISVSGCQPGTGSSISSYTFSGQNISSTTTATSVTSSSVINPSMSEETVILKYTVTVTDNRGRTASAEKSITCYNYAGPTFKSFKSYRANSSGTATNDGSYLKCEYKVTYYDVNSTNKIYNFSISGTGSTNITYSSWTTSKSSGIVTATGNALVNLNGNTTTTYNVYGTIVDNYGGSKNSSKSTAHGAFRIMNITKDGTGVAIGKMAESSDLFDCKHKAQFRNTLNSTGNITTDGSFGSSSAYSSNNFASYCQWADGNNHDILVRNSDGLTTGLGWVGSDTYQTALDIRPKTVRIRGTTNIENTVTAPRGRFTSTTDAAHDAQNNVALRIGSESGEHIDIDSNEIIAKDGPTTAGDLFLCGSTVYIYTGSDAVIEVGRTQSEGCFIKSTVTQAKTYSASPNMYITTGGLFGRGTSSSKRYKTDVDYVKDDDLNPYNILNIPVRQFKYNKDNTPIDRQQDDLYIGFIAEEVEEAYPAAAEYTEDGQVEMWNIKVIVPAMLKIIQDQQKEICELKESIKELKTTIQN